MWITQLFGVRTFSATAEYRDWPALIITIDAGLFSFFTPCFAVRNAMSLTLATLFVTTFRESPIQVLYTIGRHFDQNSRHSLVSPTFRLFESHRRRDSLNFASLGRFDEPVFMDCDRDLASSLIKNNALNDLRQTELTLSFIELVPILPQLHWKF